MRYLAALICLSVALPAGAQSELPSHLDLRVTQTAATVSDMQPINKLNDHFRALYADARTRERNRAVPVILAVGDKVILLNNGERSEYTFIPEDWSVLKSVDHVPLAIFVALHDKAGAALDEHARGELQQLGSLLDTAMPSMLSAKFPPNITARNESILKDSQRFLSAVLSKGSVSSDGLNEFARGMAARSLENADDAEVMELTRLDDQVQAWKSSMTPAQWNSLHVVVTTGHMPRREERRFQYFAKLLGEKEEGGRIIVQEGSDDENGALNLLATHLLDRSIAEAYFHDPERMHRDLLSEGAHKFLKKSPPRE